MIKMTTTKQCPLCAEEIKAEALVCRYCGARFNVSIKGYCQNCHALREVSEYGQCRVCSNAVIDLRVESNLIEAPVQKPTTTSEPAAQPENRTSGTKKVAAITGTIVTSLLCGLPGLLITGVGLAIINGLLSPEAQTEELTELLAQMDLTKQEFARYSLIASGIGFLLILIPIMFGVLTLRKKKPASSGNNQAKKSFSAVLARITLVCLFLAGSGYLAVNFAKPKLTELLVVPTATSTPNIVSLNVQSPAGKEYDTAQQIADEINANGLACRFNEANLSSVPIIDIGQCWFTKEEVETLGLNLHITIELFANAIPPLVQTTREGYWDSYSDSIKGLTDSNAEILAGPNWFIHGKLSALIEAQKILGGDILNLFSDSDRQIYITR